MKFDTTKIDEEIAVVGKRIDALTEFRDNLTVLRAALTNDTYAEYLVLANEAFAEFTPVNTNGQVGKNRVAGALAATPKKKHKGRASMSAPNIINALVKAGKPLTIREIKTATGMADMTIRKALGKNSNGFEKTPVNGSNGFVWSLKSNVANAVVVPAKSVGRNATSLAKIEKLLSNSKTAMTCAEIVKRTGVSKSSAKKVLANSGRFAIFGQHGRENTWSLKEVFDIVK